MSSSPETLRLGADQVDYQETADLTEVHAAVGREYTEPLMAGSVPVPIWLMSLCGVTLFWAGTYLGMFSGGFRGDVYNPFQGVGKPAEASASKGGGEGGAKPGVEDSLAAQGKRFFTQNCVSCHQASGTGLPGQYPPLARSEYVNGSPKRLAMILLKGVQGPLTVGGASFNGAMPAWERTLSDKKIAAVLSYIRQDWGNKGGEITPEQLAAARKEFAGRAEPWAESDLKAVPEDAQLEGGAKPAPPTEAGKPAAPPAG
jgi:mono/diheme cytochrome c family protein